MIIYPTLELLNGNCVSLTRGRLESASIWHVDPIDITRGWAEAGADWMHITDFDAIEGKDTHTDLLVEIIRSVGIPVQLGGGFRTADQVADWIDRGAGRVVISTLAARDPQTVKALANAYPDQIALSVDVWEGHVMMDGWREKSAYRPEDFIRSFNDDPFASIVITDIAADVSDRDAQLAELSNLAALSHAPVIASGVVRSLDDIARLKYVPNIAGAIVGRALFNKTVNAAEAIVQARPDREPVAEFI